MCGRLSHPQEPQKIVVVLLTTRRIAKRTLRLCPCRCRIQRLREGILPSTLWRRYESREGREEFVGIVFVLGMTAQISERSKVGT